MSGENASVHQFPPRKGRGSSTVNAPLQKGSSGPAVTELKAKLNLLGYGPLKLEDANFDEATHTAVELFQQSVQMVPTGVYDTATDAQLNAKVLQSTGTMYSSRARGMGDAAPSAPVKRPIWQTGLMVLGGLALAGGIIYMLSKEKDDGLGYKRALPGREIDHDEGVSTRYKIPSSRLRRVAGIDKCEKMPGEDAWTEGKVLS